MKGVVYTKYGSPDVLKIEKVEKPVPKDNEVLIKVYAATVNRTDDGFLRAKPFIVRIFSGLTKPKNTILGNEFAGKVEEIGRNVKSFKVSDKVFGYNDTTFGAHAQYVTMPEEGMLTTMPASMTYEEMAPSTEGAHYALNDIREAKVERGQRVLINGASGAIGTAAVQLVKYYGGEVTTVCNTKNVKLVKSLGATKVIDYTREDFTEDGGEYDFVFDAVGKSSFGACKKLLKPEGTYCSTELGTFFQNPFLALWTKIFGSIPAGRAGKKVIFPIPRDRKEDIEFLKKLIENGTFKAVIDRIYPLEKIVEAYRYVEKGHKRGNVVIRVVDKKGK